METKKQNRKQLDDLQARVCIGKILVNFGLVAYFIVGRCTTELHNG